MKDMHCDSPRQPSHLGFTLAEVLVTIAVAGILATLLFSGARSLQASADNARCVANLKVSGQAMLQYFQDNNGDFFPSKNWFQYPSTKSGSNRGMRDYFGIPDHYDIKAEELKYDTMLTCPAMKRIYPQYYPGPLNRGFGLNCYLEKNLPGSPQRMINVPKPSAMWILTDSAINKAVLGTINEKTVGTSSSNSYLPFPHQGRQNVFFFDGHIEALSLENFTHPPSPRDFWGNLLLPE